MSKIQGICPHVPSSNPAVTKSFFQEILGFNVCFEFENYIELEKDGCLIGIQKSQGKPNEQSIYLRIEELDDFWQSHKGSLSKYNPREPFVQDYGMKEIHVIVPETNTLLFIGENANA